MALAILALKEWKIEKNDSAAQGLINMVFYFYADPLTAKSSLPRPTTSSEWNLLLMTAHFILNNSD